MSGKETVASLIKKMIAMHLDMNKAKILIVGAGKMIDETYNYDSDVIVIAKELQEYDIKTHLYDPLADKKFLKDYYNIHCENKMEGFGQVTTYSGFIITGHLEGFNIGPYKRGRFALTQL